MINKLKQWRIIVENMARRHNEYLGLIIALLLLYFFPILIRKIDPSAAPIDPGILSGIVLAVVAVLVFNSVTWWLIRAIWPVFADYSNTFFSTDFQSLLPWQRVCIYLCFFLYFVSSFLLALVAIL